MDSKKPSKKKFLWLKNRTKIEKGLIAILALVIITTIFFACQLVKKISSSERYVSNVCMTKECVKSAASILEKINDAISPCDDFYQFVCDNFITQATIPDDQTSISSVTYIYDRYQAQLRTILEKPVSEDEPRSLKLIKAMYKSCMNVTKIEKEGLNYMKNMFREFGGWPVVQPHIWNERSFDWIKLVYRFRKINLRQNMFFNLYIGADQKNSSKRILSIVQPCMSYELLKKGFNESTIKAYYDYAVDVATLFGADKESATEEMRDVVEFEINLANVTDSRDIINSTLTYNPMRIRELQKNVSSVPWLEYINGYLAPGGEKLTSHDFVNVDNPKILGSLEDLLLTTSKRTLANYMFWTVVRSSVNNLPEVIRKRNADYISIAYGRTAPSPRWEQCARMSHWLSIAVSSLYVKNFVKKGSKNKVHELVSDIKESFFETLENTGWMDRKTKHHALLKAKKMESFIGYPEELLDDKTVDDEYKSLELDADAYLFEINLNLSSFRHKKTVKELRKPIDKLDWRDKTYVYAVNAYYEENGNSIELPAGILQDPFFNENRPQYLNYGSIGFIVGHEITHGFDDRGRQYDKDGNLMDWWEPETNLTFSNKAQCLVEQYGNYTVPDLEIALNGVKNLGENIADNGGIKIAYRGYQKWMERNDPEEMLPGLSYTPQQMFWISAAMPFCTKYKKETLKRIITSGYHAPNYFRIIVPFMNSEYFAKDFKCPLGSPMNPRHKCKVW